MPRLAPLKPAPAALAAPPAFAALIAPALLLAVALLPGCVSRKLFLRTDPPGAIVYLDGVRAGVTPYEGEIPAYGTRRAEFELPGYQRRAEDIALPWPWWQYVPLDIVTDLLIPWTIEDDRSFSFAMQALDPDKATLDDAKAAYERMKAMKSASGDAPPATQPSPAPAGGAGGAGGGD